MFGEDVQVVPKENADALAAAITRAPARTRRRTQPATADTIVARRFRADSGGAGEYWKVYAEAISARGR